MALKDVGKIKQTTLVTLYHPDPACNLLNPDGSEMTVTLHGPYSDRYKAVVRDQQQRRMTELSRGGGRRGVTLTPEEVDAFADELMARCIEGWKIWLAEDEELVFSPEKIPGLFAEYPWIRDQLNAALGNVADFLDTPKKH
jgi:hypothetical protein